VKTDSTKGCNRNCDLVKAIEEKINEYQVKCLFLQHTKEPEKVYVGCCVKENVCESLKEAKTLQYIQSGIGIEIFLKEGASVTVKASMDISFISDHVLRLKFSPWIYRPLELYMQPSHNTAATHSKPPWRGYVLFVVAPRDLGPSELRYRDLDDQAVDDVTLCSMPFAIKVRYCSDIVIGTQIIILKDTFFETFPDI
jgi:hypothetical protein